MIKRLFNIARAEFTDLVQKNKAADIPEPEPDIFEIHQEESDPLAKYYANLEIPVGSDRETIKTAWKTQLKKYHPDLHGSDPKKKQIAEELTRQLNEAYRILDSAFLKK
ncbi:MAG: J domain-containing protein [Nitrospinae bacterium]|nr:J domain-containing protein [Nitrospinota bacterium]